MNRPRIPFVSPLVKIALIWFLCGYAASRVAVTFGSSPVPIVQIATAAFALHSASLWFRTALSDGVSPRLRLGGVACLIIAGLMFFSLHQINLHNYGFGTLTPQLDPSDESGAAFKALRPIEHLAAATKLVFEDQNQKALVQARRHLSSIPNTAEEYGSAEALRRVVESRSNELLSENQRGLIALPIQVIARDRTSDGLRLVLRNNGKRAVTRIKYRLAYFRILDGWYVPPDKHSEIAQTIPPNETRTVQISDDLVRRGVLYAFFDLISWQASPTS